MIVLAGVGERVSGSGVEYCDVLMSCRSDISISGISPHKSLTCSCQQVTFGDGISGSGQEPEKSKDHPTQLGNSIPSYESLTPSFVNTGSQQDSVQSLYCTTTEVPFSMKVCYRETQLALFQLCHQWVPTGT